MARRMIEVEPLSTPQLLLPSHPANGAQLKNMGKPPDFSAEIPSATPLRAFKPGKLAALLLLRKQRLWPPGSDPEPIVVVRSGQLRENLARFVGFAIRRAGSPVRQRCVPRVAMLDRDRPPPLREHWTSVRAGTERAPSNALAKRLQQPDSLTACWHRQSSSRHRA